MEEQGTHKPLVASSNLALGTHPPTEAGFIYKVYTPINIYPDQQFFSSALWKYIYIFIGMIKNMVQSI